MDTSDFEKRKSIWDEYTREERNVIEEMLGEGMAHRRAGDDSSDEELLDMLLDGRWRSRLQRDSQSGGSDH